MPDTLLGHNSDVVMETDNIKQRFVTLRCTQNIRSHVILLSSLVQAGSSWLFHMNKEKIIREGCLLVPVGPYWKSEFSTQLHGMKNFIFVSIQSHDFYVVTY